MIERLLDKLAPPKATAPAGEHGYRRLLRWAALPVTDRRWAAPLAAVALGFGLFAGVAIGPGASGTFAGGVAQIIEIPALVANGAGGEEGGEEEAGEPAPAEAPPSGGPSASEEGAFTPLVTEAGFEAPEGEAETPATAGPTPEKEEPSSQENEELAGTVVHVNPAAGSYTVVESGGVMSAVHAGKLPRAGAQVEVPIETLANGTLGEAGKRVKTGERARATLAGIVTSVDADPSAPSYAVSNRGSSVLVRVHPDPAGALPPLPALGAYMTVAVEIEARSPSASSSTLAAAFAGEPPASEPPVREPPETEPAPTETPPTQPATPAQVPPPAPPAPSCAPDPAHPPLAAEPRSVLWQRRASGGGAPFTHGDFAGAVTAICPAMAQLMVSADDTRESGRDVTFAVPPGLDLSKLEVGESILASAEIAADGALTLKGLASDEHRKGAEDAKATQGDLRPAKKPKG